MIYDLAFAMGEPDVRGLMARLSYAELVVWAVYLRARELPQRPWIRDADQASDIAAAYYG